jgi:heme/copper-type cytochrome/quinol oxidase subunit 2
MKRNIAVIAVGAIAVAALVMATLAYRRCGDLDDEIHRHLSLQATNNDWRWSIVRSPARLDSLWKADSPAAARK